MKMKYIELKKCVQPLNIINKESKLSYAEKITMMKLTKSIETELKEFLTLEEEIKDKHIPRDDDGNKILDEKGVFIPTNIEQFNLDFKELYNVDVEINIKKIKKTILENASELTVNDIMLLSSIIDI